MVISCLGLRPAHKSSQSYNFFLIYASFMAEIVFKGSFLCVLGRKIVIFMSRSSWL